METLSSHVLLSRCLLRLSRCAVVVVQAALTARANVTRPTGTHGSGGGQLWPAAFGGEEEIPPVVFAVRAC